MNEEISSNESKVVDRYFRDQFPVLQNITTETETILTILRPKDLILKYKIFDLNKNQVSSFILSSSTVHNEFNIDKLELSKLNADKNYLLLILDKKAEYILDARLFHTLNTKKEKISLAIASCARVGWMGGDYGPLSIWRELKAQQPDALIFMGDWVYPDTILQALLYLRPSLEQNKDRYVESWQSIHYYHQKELTPTFSVLDDHDYGFQGANAINNEDRKHQMFDYFRTFYPVFSESTDAFRKGPGASFQIKLFDFNLILLDNKFYRSASGPEKIDGPIWGDQQLNWMGEILSQSKHPSLIGSGTLFSFPVFNHDAAQYESPDEFNKLLSKLKESKEDLVLLSGDVHFSDVKKIHTDLFDKDIYELTSSRIHSIHPSIIPPFINGYVGREKDQLIHTADKNFMILKLTNGSLKNAEVEIHAKNSDRVLRTHIYEN